MHPGGSCMTEIRRNLQILWSAVLSEWLLSPPRCNTDRQVCSHAHSTCASATQVMKIQSTTTVTSNSPKAPLQTRCVPQLGKADRLTQKGQHNTSWGWNCANRAVYTVSRFGKVSKQKNIRYRSQSPHRVRLLLATPPRPVCTPYSLYVHHTANRCQPHATIDECAHT